MDTELTAKCACTHCGNHIEFPIDVAGQFVHCPHCNEATQLNLDAPPRPSDKPSAAELLAAFGGPVGRTRVSVVYRLGLILVTMMMVLLPVVYLLLIAAVAFGTYWYATHFTSLLHFSGSYRSGRIYVGRLILYATPIASGIVLLVFMLKPLFAKRMRPPQPLAMNPAVEPTLYAFIAKICDLVGAPMPKRIDLVCDLNAAAGFRRGAASFFGNDLVLTIGLPLVAGLSLREFAGIIAHEFGHFTQGFGMRLSYIIRHINAWFARLVYQRDSMDEALYAWGNQAEDAGVLILVNVVRAAVGSTRLVLKLLMFMAHGVSCFLLRQMEHDADSYEIKVAGSATSESAIRRMAELGDAMNRSYKEVRATWNMNRRLPDDFPAFMVLQHSRLPAPVRERMQDRLGLSKTGVFDTHPSDGDRIRQARRAEEPGVFHLDLPASVLFSRFDIVSKQITHLHYKEDLELQFDEVNLRPVESVAAPAA
jgi:Zn-dependent protease with chaperone function